MWEKLQEEGGTIRESCLLGGKTIKEAIREGGFKRSGMLSKEQATGEIKEVRENKTLSWVNRVHEGSKETSMNH